MTLQLFHPEFHLDDAFLGDTVDLEDDEVAIDVNELSAEEAAVEGRDNMTLSVAMALQKADRHFEYRRLVKARK